MQGNTPVDPYVARPFDFPSFAGRSVFVLGLGGGCDAIGAFAVADLVKKRQGAREVVYGNTKRVADNLEAVTPHLFRVTSWQPTGEEIRTSRLGGTTVLDHALPRGDRDCPFVVVMPPDRNEDEVAEEIRSLGFSLLIGVDLGGDSLTEAASSGPLGRDRWMLDVLHRTGIPVLHIVLAPGCDGETTCDDLRAAMKREDQCGRFLGSFPIANLQPQLFHLNAYLPARRTSNLIAAAGRLQPAGPGVVLVPRGIKPAIPLPWLASGFVFGDPATLSTN